MSYSRLPPRETILVAEATRRSMRGNKSKNTLPEQTVRKALWAAGLRGFRKNVGNLPGKPDVVYRNRGLAVFIHGCFWHGCPNCNRNLVPKTNHAYWEAKVRQNRDRDAANAEKLSALGFTVLVFWECEIRKDLLGVVEAVRLGLRQ